MGARYGCKGDDCKMWNLIQQLLALGRTHDCCLWIEIFLTFFIFMEECLCLGYDFYQKSFISEMDCNSLEKWKTESHQNLQILSSLLLFLFHKTSLNFELLFPSWQTCTLIDWHYQQYWFSIGHTAQFCLK